jgi:hypothetical protein
MAQNKTTETGASVDDFLASIENDTRRQDSTMLLDIMRRATGVEPRMWGPAIIGFGRYHYKYESGREGEMLRVGFSPRKANLAVYLIAKNNRLRERMNDLGKHKTGGSCLYVNKLSDVDLDVLEELVVRSWQLAQEEYGANTQ